MPSNDRTLPTELDALARDLEERAGTQPALSLRRETGLPALVRRCRDAVLQALTNIEDSIASLGTDGLVRQLSFAIQDPENAKTNAGRGTQSTGVWLNDSGRTFRITSVRAISDVDDYTFALYKSASTTDLSTANDTLLVTVACSTDDTSAYSAHLTTFTEDTIENGKWLIWEHVSGTAEAITVVVKGTYL